jgi:hypothetical protein
VLVGRLSILESLRDRSIKDKPHRAEVVGANITLE